MYVRVRKNACVMESMWRSGVKFQNQVLSFHLGIPKSDSCC